MFLWRAVDDEGQVLDVLVQKWRNKAAALKLLRKLLKSQGVHPETIVTDKLASYGRGAGPRARRPPPTRRHAGQQSRRELASRDTTTRTKTAEVQIAGLSPKVPLHPRRDLQRFQPSAPSDPPAHAAPVSHRSASSVGGGDGFDLSRGVGRGFRGLADLTCQFRLATFHPRRSDPECRAKGDAPLNGGAASPVQVHPQEEGPCQRR